MSRAPIVDADSYYYWDQLKHHRLVLQRCDACEKHVFYPRAICPHCHNSELSWVEASGNATLYSFTISRRPASPDFQGLVPYVVALVDLDEGVRMLTNLRVDDPSDVRIGQRLRVDFEILDPETTLPVFVPYKSPEGRPASV